MIYKSTLTVIARVSASSPYLEEELQPSKMFGKLRISRVCAWLILVDLSSLLSLGSAALCDNTTPITQKAYVGPYVLDFPTRKGSSNNRAQPSGCAFKIQTYRKDYVIQLQFEQLSLVKDEHTGVCKERITVYDGPTTVYSVMASFCDGSPEMVTSSDEALIVFTPASDQEDTSGRLFSLNYKAVVERRHAGDTSHILRIGFGTFIGVIAFIVVCSGVCRKYKQAHPERSFFQFGGSRAGSSARAGRARGAQQPPPHGQSLRGKITGFFEAIFIKLTPTRHARARGSVTSTDYNETTLTAAEQLRRAGQAVHLRNTRGRYSTDGGRDSSTGTATGLEFGLSPVNVMGTVSPDNIGDHVIFGYQNIPSTSFTSDPGAVKPPTYEEVVNNANPLYLYHHGTYSNPVFSLKDEPAHLATAFSPPPPYSEVPLDTAEATAPPGPGHDRLVRNGTDPEYLGQGRAAINTSVSSDTTREVTHPESLTPGARTDQSTRVSSGEATGTEGAAKAGQEESPASNGSSTSPAMTLLSLATSSPQAVTTGEPFSSSPSSSRDSDVTVEMGGARLREPAREADVTVGVGGVRVHTTAENRTAAPLTPVYLNQGNEGAASHRSDDSQDSTTNLQLHCLNVTQAGNTESSSDSSNPGDTRASEADDRHTVP